MTTKSARNKCFALIIASQDSTAAFVAALMNNLIQHAHIYKSLKDEVTAFEREGKLSSPIVKVTETNTMPLHLLCAKETLRLNPSTPVILPHRVSKGGVELNWILVLVTEKFLCKMASRSSPLARINQHKHRHP